MTTTRSLLPLLSKETEQFFGVKYTEAAKFPDGQSAASGALKPGVAIDLIQITQNDLMVRMGFVTPMDKVIPETLRLARLHVRFKKSGRNLSIPLVEDWYVRFDPVHEDSGVVYTARLSLENPLYYAHPREEDGYRVEPMDILGLFNPKDQTIQVALQENSVVELLGYEITGERQIALTMKAETPQEQPKTLVQLIPIVTNDNQDHFAHVFEPFSDQEGYEAWWGLSTGLLKFDVTHNLIELSQTPDLLARGVVSETDTLGQLLMIGAIGLSHNGREIMLESSPESETLFTQANEGAKTYKLSMSLAADLTESGIGQVEFSISGVYDQARGLIKINLPVCTNPEVTCVGYTLKGARHSQTARPEPTLTEEGIRAFIDRQLKVINAGGTIGDPFVLRTITVQGQTCEIDPVIALSTENAEHGKFIRSPFELDEFIKMLQACGEAAWGKYRKST